MSKEDPCFLSREQVNEQHAISLSLFGGAAGVGSETGLESALGAPRNDFFYAGADLFGIAAAMPSTSLKRKLTSTEINARELLAR